MTAIERSALSPTADVAAMWEAAARQALRWVADKGIAVRDVVVLVPYAALLPPARRAFAAPGGWLPRIETPQTLAEAFGPPPHAPPGLCSGEQALDRLTALQLLQREPWTAEGEPGEWGHLGPLADLVVQAAQELRAAAHARSPAARPAFWGRVREAIRGEASPGTTDARLLRLACDWVARGTVAATDALFGLRPAAWIVLRLGGTDSLAQALMDAASVPCLLLDADPASERPFERTPEPSLVRRWRCVDGEIEAQAAAAEVIEALNEGRTPVALVALDRERVRRTRALLERAGVPMVDETGWRLSTTRAATRVMALLRAAAPGAGRDALLGWMKTWPRAPAAGIVALEALWRDRRRVRDREAAARLERDARAFLEPLGTAGTCSLAAWIDRLRERLAADGSLDLLRTDAAGRQVLTALWLEPGVGAAGLTTAWTAAASAVPVDLQAFSKWVESALDAAPYQPPPAPGAAVTLTPLARVIGRPFGHVVVPGADHEHLGPVARPPSLIGQALAGAIGLETAHAQRQRQRVALMQVMRVGAVTLLRRRQEAGEVIADSPDLAWLLAERARAGAAPWPLRDFVPAPAVLTPQAVAAPHPQGGRALPAALTATAVQALRDCPYRFFAREVLRLDEPAELEAALAKRDYGEWLHLVLMRFHAQRDPAHDDAGQLAAAADWATAQQGLDEGELLPYRASFESFAPAYLAWLAEREALGWRWQAGEVDCRVVPAALAPTALRGRIDRIDVGPDGTRFVLDYKTGSVTGFRQQVREPLEDTQLAFYAALLDDGGALRAAYLALDGREAPVQVEHLEVQRSARAMVQGLADEVRRLRDGAPLRALGEGRVCELCEARGLCRRDHWGPSE